MDDKEKQVIEQTVHCTLTKLGFDLSDPIAAQEDMHFLRSLRHFTQACGTKAVMTLVGLVTIAVAGGVVLAIGKAITKTL